MTIQGQSHHRLGGNARRRRRQRERIFRLHSLGTKSCVNWQTCRSAPSLSGIEPGEEPERQCRRA
jgi:hypothetical protein